MGEDRSGVSEPGGAPIGAGAEAGDVAGRGVAREGVERPAAMRPLQAAVLAPREREVAGGLCAFGRAERQELARASFAALRAVEAVAVVDIERHAARSREHLADARRA